eukprot:4230210-Lingulodinium_polyedra.AAC.1
MASPTAFNASRSFWRCLRCRRAEPEPVVGGCWLLGPLPRSPSALPAAWRAQWAQGELKTEAKTSHNCKNYGINPTCIEQSEKE